MIIAATGDVHSPRYFEDFVRSVDSIGIRPDLLLMVGDMINRGVLEEFEKIYNTLFGKFSCPMVSCFGNNEFGELRGTLKKNYGDIKFLDDESVVLTIGGMSIGIVGTTGSLDSPTPWQRKNVPNIETIYRERVDFVDKLLQNIKADLRILLIHYSPTYKTLEGETQMFYPGLGSQMYERVIIERKPDLVVHGHSHRGTRLAWLDTIPVFNVSLPLNRHIVIINTEKDLKPGIAKFV